MIPTKGMMALTVLSCLILLNPPISRADSSAVIPANAGIHNKITSRDTIIQKQLDCASSHLKNTSVDWQDVCDMPEVENQDQEGKDEVVNRQLDDVSKEFPAMQPNAEKEFPPMQPERPSAWKMFKGLFNPDPVGAPQPATTSNV